MSLADLKTMRDENRKKLIELYANGAKPADMTTVVENQIAKLNKSIRDMTQVQFFGGDSDG